MKFFNIDMHISVIADIKKIFKELGHEVEDKTLSGHAHIMGKPGRDGIPGIDVGIWTNLSDEMCDNFYKLNKHELEQYDGFICCYPPPFSLLYKNFNKPIIVVAATRYEYPLTDRPERWKQFNEYLKSPNIIRLANNLLDQRYAECMTGLKWDTIPSLCEYTNAKYNPNNNLSVLYSEYGGIDNPEIINKTSLGNYTWENLYQHKSIIHVPYNTSTMSIFEQYTANMPLFFPTKELLFKFFKEGKALGQLSFTQIFRSINYSLSSYNFDNSDNSYDINRLSDDNIIKRAIDLADYYDEKEMPFIQLFNSQDELIDKLNNSNLKDISDSMKKHNIARKESVYNKWSNVLSTIK